MAVPPHCVHCGRPPYRPGAKEPEAISPLKGTPSPPGEYRWAGQRWRYHYGRIAALLGKQPDGVLARAISCPRKQLAMFRRRLQIPPYHPLRGFEDLIGRVPDAVVARRASCNPQTVGRYRKRHSIPQVSRSAVYADRRLQAYIRDLEKLFER